MLWNYSNFYNNVCLKDDRGSSLTYQQLKHENDKIYSYIGKRSLVMVLCSNTMGSIIGYTAFMQNGVVPLMINSQLDDILIAALLSKYCPEYIWLPDAEADRVMTAEMSCIYDEWGYKLIKTNYDRRYEINPELGLLLTTSGSTGSPKFVRQSVANVKVNAHQIVCYLHIDESERPITTLPMNYTYGLSIINSHLCVGATILVTDKSLAQKEFWSFFKDEKATSFGGVPYTYEILEKLRFLRMDLPYLRYMTQAGGKLSPELHKRFAEYALETNKKFVVMYGACEATARMGFLPAEKSLEKYGSCGIAIPEGQFSLVDTEGNIINESDVVGELIYEGPNVTLGYAECGEDLIKGDERSGRLATGDMAKRDAEGFYYIVGRKKRFLKIYGNRVNLDEIDRLIKEEFDYIQCASSGVDDHMYIFVTDASKSEEIRKFISEKTKLNLAAFKVVVIDEIPKNDAGKTLYKELAKYYEHD